MTAWQGVVPGIFLMACGFHCHAAYQGRLVATGGLLTAEGQAGGGLVPWAVMAGLSTKPGWDWVAVVNHFDTDDFHFNAVGVAASWNDRVEVSLLRQRLGLDFDAPGWFDNTIDQTILGAKVKVAGDLIYSRMPQLSLGAQWKMNHDGELTRALGASDSRGVDVLFSASKMWLDGPFHRNVLLNGTVRGTRGNEIGLLGFGSNQNDGYDWLVEGSAAMFFNPEWALGVEYRQKPEGLSGLKESDWRDVFVAWFPNSQWNIALAWIDLGRIAARDRQTGYYLSVNGNWP